jgi:CRP-like cAMP-binding protein
MVKRPTSPTEPSNRLLDRLPEATRSKLLPLLRPVELKFEQVLYESFGPIDYAYFPAGGVLSALTVMRDGNAIEVATLGYEGLVGHYGFGGKTSPHKVLVQIGGGGYRVAAPALDELAEGDGPLKELLTAYHIAFMAQVSQSVACNGLHRLEPRCCRWLLMSRDRVGSDDLRLTHEFLAVMLGARRASVTEALGPLQEAGLVESSRGVIRILDGAGLEARSCECYGLVRDRYEELLGG